MNRLFAVFLLALACCVPAAHAQEAAQGDIIRSGVAFPARILDYRRLDLRDYEAETPGLGFSVGYQSPAMTATVYLYDRGRKHIPPGPGSAVVQGEFEQSFDELKEFVLRRNHPHFKAMELKDRGELKPPAAAIGYRYLAVDLVGDRGRRRSFLFVTGFRGKFLKVRITVHGASGNAEARAFIKALSKVLTRQTAMLGLGRAA